MKNCKCIDIQRHGHREECPDYRRDRVTRVDREGEMIDIEITVQRRSLSREG